MRRNLKFTRWMGGVILFLAACQSNTPTPPPPATTETPTTTPTSSATATASPTSPSASPTPLPETATLAPTLVPTVTETPTSTPAPFTVSIWPSLGEPVASVNDKPFTLQDGELFAGGLRQGQGWFSGGWAVSGAFYEEADVIHISGYLKCLQNNAPVSCDYESLNMQVGGGGQEGAAGTPGFQVDLEKCIITEEPDLTLKFECVGVPDRGFGTPFEYIWLRTISGQGGQLQDVHITVFGLDWSGVLPTATP